MEGHEVWGTDWEGYPNRFEIGCFRHFKNVADYSVFTKEVCKANSGRMKKVRKLEGAFSLFARRAFAGPEAMHVLSRHALSYACDPEHWSARSG